MATAPQKPLPPPPPPIEYYEDDEEERRRREQQEQQAQQFGAPIEPIKPLSIEPEPIKQTITYDPVSGEQRMKIEGNARDLSAENPLTPTLTMPGAVSPEQMAQQQQMELAAQQQEREAQAQAQAQAQAAQTQQQMPQPQLPQPGPGVQVAGPAQMPPAAPAAQPYMGPGQGAEAQTIGAPVAQPAPQPVQQPPATDAIGMFTSAVGDTNKLLQIYNDKNQPPVAVFASLL